MFKKIIWAVDPVAPNRKVQNATLKAVLALTKGSNGSIEPVCVLSPDQLRIPVSVFRRAGGDYRLRVEKDLDQWMKGLKSPRLQRPTLLTRDVFSENESVDTVLKYARESGADLIAVATRVRKGLKRWLLGSFAETLLLKSEIPTLILNPHVPPPKAVKTILFPTDFSRGSDVAFGVLLATAAQQKVKVILYYKPDYLLPVTSVAFGMVPDYVDYLNADLDSHRELAGRWAQRAKASGVKCEVVLDKKPGFVEESILAAAKKHRVDLIAMASNSGRVGAALLGSITRQVVRDSHKPVWVIHPSAAVASARRSEERVKTGLRLA